MACDLSKIKFPQLSLPSIERLKGIDPSDSIDLEEVNKCFEWTSPFGTKIKPPKRLADLQGKIPTTINTGMTVLQTIMSALMPLEALTEVVKPIAEVLQALDGETDPATIVEKLVELGDTLLSLFTLFTNTYPLLLLSEILQMIQCICEAITLIKDFLTAVTQFIDQVNTLILDFAGKVTTSITNAVTDSVSKAATALTDLDSAQTSVDEKFNQALDINELTYKNTTAYLGNILGGSAQLASEGLTSFGSQVVSPPIKAGKKKLRNLLIKDPSNPDNRGARGQTATYFSEQKERLANLLDSDKKRTEKQQQAMNLKIAGMQLTVEAQLPSLEECFTAILQELGDLVNTYSQNLQTLSQNVVEAAVKNIGSALTGLTAPLLDVLPDCP